jgi:hypothetical protein
MDAVQAHASGIERLEISLGEIRKAPFFAQLHSLVTDLITLHCPRDSYVSYAIWGGVAANLILQLFGLTKMFYSVHDIEMFFVRCGGVVHENERLSDLVEPLLANGPRFRLKLGGRKILRDHSPGTFDAFQSTRIGLPDGDLCLNNLALWVDRPGARVVVTAPTGTISSLSAGVLELKPCSLLTPQRMARRISRTVAKTIRFERAAALRLSICADLQLQALMTAYSCSVERETSVGPWDDTTRAWRAAEGIVDVSTGLQWLYLLTISETVKRIAPLSGVSRRDRHALRRLVLDRSSNGESLLAHPLLESLRGRIPDTSWATQARVRREIVQRGYSEFTNYQQAGAERLPKMYAMQ